MQYVRRLWLAAACTLAFVVSATAVQAQTTKFLPNDTELVVTFNLQQILKSEVLKDDAAKGLVDLIKGQVNQGLADKGLDKPLKTAGFDIFRDLVSITFAAPGGRPVEESFIVIEGKFDAAKIEAAGKEAGAGFKVIEIASTKAFEIAPKGDKKMYVGILNEKILIACGSKADFIEAVERLGGSKTAAFKAAVFKSLVETVSSKQSISFVATGNILSKMADKLPDGRGDQLKAAAPEVDGLSLSITVQKDLDVLLGVNAKDAKTAKQFAGLANAGIRAAREKVAEKAKEDEKSKLALDVLKTVEATAKGSNLMIRGQVSFGNLGMILKNLPLP